MANGSVIVFDTNLSAPALSKLEASGPAAWLIDVTAGCVLAANTAGAALLGLSKSGPPPTLDAAMPALVRLRALLSAEAEDTRELLVFWRHGEVLRRSCHVSLERDGSPVLARVAVLDDAAADSDGPSGADVEPDVGAGAASIPRALRASLAHELKTPISAIAAAAEIMKDQRFGPLGSERYVGYAADILGSAQHALSLVDRMLADGRTARDQDNAARQLTFTEVALEDVLQAAVSQLTLLAERAGLALSLEVVPRLPHLIADATSLRQIVFNLVTNALKFTDRGGRITVAAHYSGDGPLTVAVSDTGRGMTEAEVTQILDGVRPVDRPSLAGPGFGGKGLGLGLPLVRALAEAHGAKFVLRSAPGEGTTASVVFASDHVIPV